MTPIQEFALLGNSWIINWMVTVQNWPTLTANTILAIIYVKMQKVYPNGFSQR